MDRMEFLREIDVALAADDPLDASRATVQKFRELGSSPAEMIEMLQAHALDLRRAGREREDDTVLEVLDFLSGWCAPHMRIE
ncbi:hypothetical protein ACWEOZ_39865 [Actinoplanes sp. NPDC004185]